MLCTDDIPDSFFLTADKFKLLPVPLMLDMAAELFDQTHGVDGGMFLGVTVLCNKTNDLVILCFSDDAHIDEMEGCNYTILYYWLKK